MTFLAKEDMTSQPSTSVLMPCLNPGPHLHDAVNSVMQQNECLELIVADGGSTDGSIEVLNDLARRNPRLKLDVASDDGPGDALNRAFGHAQGTLIGWLNADDLYSDGSLIRAANALRCNPEWLMVYGEGMELNTETGCQQRYPTKPPNAGLKGFQSHCFICQPTVVFRRTMAIMLGPFDQTFRTAFDFEYWLRAFSTFEDRIGYIPHLQGITRIHDGTITSTQRAQVALEATALLSRHFGAAPCTRLHNYALELQIGIANKTEEVTLQDHLTTILQQAEPFLAPAALAELRHTWLLNETSGQDRLAEEECAAALGWHRSLPGRLFQALRPDLRIETPGPPAGPYLRLKAAVIEAARSYPLLRALQGEITEPEITLHPFNQRPFGVNLIGHAFDVFGIGEDIRMAARSLQAVGVPCCVIDHPARNGASRGDHSLEDLVIDDANGGPYAFNLVCMAAPIQARWLLESGLTPLRERYTLVAWPWETEQWPEAWLPLFQVADELWPSSSFTAKALRAESQASLPLRVMPMAAEIPAVENYCNHQARQKARQKFGLPADAVLFIYGFDFNSTAIRKNPIGTLEAFQKAFPPTRQDALGRRVGLVIKTFEPSGPQAEFHMLLARAKEDPRIHLVVGSLVREDLLALYGCCDVFLSLHRSEGFGRGMAEALQMGLDVIATDYGGNTDFCTGPLAHPIRYRRVPIPRGAYPCADGHYWAEPDIEHACELIRAVAAERLSMRSTGKKEAAEFARAYAGHFSHHSVGTRYRLRLQELWADRGTINQQLGWGATRSPIKNAGSQEYSHNSAANSQGFRRHITI